MQNHNGLELLLTLREPMNSASERDVPPVMADVCCEAFLRFALPFASKRFGSALAPFDSLRPKVADDGRSSIVLRIPV